MIFTKRECKFLKFKAEFQAEMTLKILTAKK